MIIALLTRISSTQKLIMISIYTHIKYNDAIDIDLHFEVHITMITKKFQFGLMPHTDSELAIPCVP